MRQRRIRNLEEKLDELSMYSVDDAEAVKGKWEQLFIGNADDHSPARLFAEFGCGKGKFIQGMAEAHPENGYIAFEGNQSVVYHAMQKAALSTLDNVRFVTHYIETAADYFDDGELDGIYLNFSDPWPKTKHEKRRLTAGTRLEDYIKVVRSGGSIEFRTDNDDLFDYTMDRLMMQSGIKIIAVTRDLHAEIDEIAKRIDITELTDAGYDDDVLDALTTREDLGITSEYEDRFSERGKSINYVRAKVI